MAYTHHNDAITSALETLYIIRCTCHGIVMMSVSHSLVSQLFGTSIIGPFLASFFNVFFFFLSL